MIPKKCTIMARMSLVLIIALALNISPVFHGLAKEKGKEADTRSEYWPKFRFRTLLVNAGVKPTGTVDFTPCETSGMPCGQACPKRAFQSGSFDRDSSNEQMKHIKVDLIITAETNASWQICI